MNDILGFMMDGDYTAFDWVADQFLDDEHVNILEIGTLFGKSAVAIDDAFTARGISHSITTIDCCLGFEGFTDPSIDPDILASIAKCRCDSDTQYQRIQESLSDRDNITFVKKFWQPDVDVGFDPDFIFYDGLHNYEESMKILNTYAPKVFAMDDYTRPRYDGVCDAVDEYVESNDKIINTFDYSKIALISNR